MKNFIRIESSKVENKKFLENMINNVCVSEIDYTCTKYLCRLFRYINHNKKLKEMGINIYFQNINVYNLK